MSDFLDAVSRNATVSSTIQLYDRELTQARADLAESRSRTALLESAIAHHAHRIRELHEALACVLRYVDAVGGFVSVEDAETLRRAREALGGRR